MTMPARKTLPPSGLREEYFSYFDGYAIDVAEEEKERHRSRTLVKSYVLETLDASVQTANHAGLLGDEMYSMEPVDESLFRVKRLEDREIIGLIEFVTNRHPVFYTLLDVDESDRLVSNIVREDPDLDQTWLAAPVFEGFWNLIRTSNSPRRFTKVGFEYIAAFDRGDGDEETGFVDLDNFKFEDSDADVIDRRTSKFTLQDRVQAVERILGFKESYSPFNSIVQMRMPSEGYGGHDIYFNGKITNRSDSFLEHRQNVVFLADRYQKMTETIESALWSKEIETESFGRTVFGVPFEIRYHEPLSDDTFESLISALRRKNNKLRLSGFYNRLGPTKVHLNGIDRHLWQPVWLEFTARRIVGILPSMSCGNIVNRMVANVQRLVDPELSVWVGDVNYGQLATSTFQ